MFSNPVVFYGLIFAAALLLVDSVLRALFSSRRAKEDVSNRLEQLKKTAGTQDAYGELLKRRGIGSRDGKQSLSNRINKYIAQTGQEFTLSKQIVGFLSLTMIGFLVGILVVGLRGPLQYVFAVVFAIAATILIIYVLRLRRITLFTNQLSPAIDILVRSLNAGHPLVSAIALVSREMPDPIGSEFGILNDQMTFGAELEQAMLNMYERVGAHELNLLTVTVSVQRGTGGNLSEILENLSQMIRDRLMIKRKIRAISAEGRITAWIMLAFPFLLFLMVRFLSPKYFDLVWESGYGPHVVIGCLVTIFLGMLIIRKLVNFDF